MKPPVFLKAGDGVTLGIEGFGGPEAEGGEKEVMPVIQGHARSA